jgi:hypothetical protein
LFFLFSRGFAQANPREKRKNKIIEFRIQNSRSKILYLMHCKTVIFTLSLIFPAFLMAQPFNGGFEEWDTVGNWEEPLGWISNSTQGFVTVHKSTDAWSGSYALRVRSNGPSFEGLAPGLVDHTWVSPGYPASVTAYVKCDTLLEPGKAIIEVYGWKNGLSYEVGKWETDELIPEFQMIEIPLFLGDGVDSLTFRGLAFTFPGPLGYEGFASFLIDQVEEGELVNLTSPDDYDKLRLYPNPCRGLLWLEGMPEGQKQLRIWAVDGGLVAEKNSTQEKIQWKLSHLPAAAYWLQVQVQNKVLVKKVILQ